MSRDKVQAILDFPVLTTVKQVRSFTGIGNFYRRYIKGFLAKIRLLTMLTRKDQPFRWDTDQQRAFKELKIVFTEYPVCIVFDQNKLIILEIDASDFAIGACLMQLDTNERLYPVAYYLRTMTKQEVNYNIYDKELLAIVDLLKHQRIYCSMSKYQVHVITDYKNLTYFTSIKELNRRQVRQVEELANYNFRVTYQKGSENARADTLSRRLDYKNNKTHVSHAVLSQNPDGSLEGRGLNLFTLYQAK